MTDFPQNFIKSNTGGRSQESGVRSQESGVRSQESEGRRKEEGGRRKKEVRKSGRRTILLCFISIDFILL
ncbi:hypothetical protein [Anabaena sp. 90]|uniref:hypothetical protein n=1 Tax=Anabaena sp. 90 TaxID=46234 RepID=UPI0002EA5179|nr:hypothetical protein [Anabaena sp. 90]